MDNPSTSRTRRIAGSFLIFPGGLVLIASAGAKLAQVPQVVTEFNAFGFEGKVTLVAILEVLSALLFLVPSSRSIGLLLVSAFLGGAIATHVQHAQSPLVPCVVLSLLWLGAWLRHPETLWSVSHRAHGTSQLPSPI
jgi:TRAP-type uncharacterized transport system fused permease subunit